MMEKSAGYLSAGYSDHLSLLKMKAAHRFSTVCGFAACDIYTKTILLNGFVVTPIGNVL